MSNRVWEFVTEDGEKGFAAFLPRWSYLDIGGNITTIYAVAPDAHKTKEGVLKTFKLTEGLTTSKVLKDLLCG